MVHELYRYIPTLHFFFIHQRQEATYKQHPHSPTWKSTDCISLVVVKTDAASETCSMPFLQRTHWFIYMMGKTLSKTYHKLFLFHMGLTELTKLPTSGFSYRVLKRLRRMSVLQDHSRWNGCWGSFGMGTKQGVDGKEVGRPPL